MSFIKKTTNSLWEFYALPMNLKKKKSNHKFQKVSKLDI